MNTSNIRCIPPSKTYAEGCSSPPDNGYKLIKSIKESTPKKIFATSDASLRNGRSTHAWVVSTGQISDLLDPNMHIRGTGSVKATRNTSPLVEANCKASQQLPLSPTLSQTSFLHLARYMLSVRILGSFRNVQNNISNQSEATENQTATYT